MRAWVLVILCAACDGNDEQVQLVPASVSDGGTPDGGEGSGGTGSSVERGSFTTRRREQHRLPDQPGF